MKTIKLFTAITAFSVLFSCGNNNTPKNVSTLDTEVDSASYALGLNVATYIKTNFTEADKDLFYQGFRNGIDSTNLLINVKDVNKVLSGFFRTKQEIKRKEQQEKAKKLAEEKFGDVKKAGEDFLAKNKTKKGIITTPSGLQYEILKKGKGNLVKANNRIKIHYHGTTIDGEVFDSTVNKKKPYESNANQFIKGFNEGLLLLNKGAKYRFYIPQELAYGYQQRGKLIKPFSALVFEVELLEILK